MLPALDTVVRYSLAKSAGLSLNFCRTSGMFSAFNWLVFNLSAICLNILLDGSSWPFSAFVAASVTPPMMSLFITSSLSGVDFVTGFRGCSIFFIYKGFIFFF